MRDYPSMPIDKKKLIDTFASDSNFSANDASLIVDMADHARQQALKVIHNTCDRLPGDLSIQATMLALQLTRFEIDINKNMIEEILKETGAQVKYV